MALDLDSTIAATCRVAFDLICGPDHDYSYADIESWEWGLEEFGEARYLSALWHAWTLRHQEIEPMEPAPSFQTYSIKTHPEVDTLDIVSKYPDHKGAEQYRRRWLDDHGIEFDEFVRVDGSKAALDYDVYVDDDPRLPAAVAERDAPGTVVVYDQPYNRDVDVPHHRAHRLIEVNQALLEVSADVGA
ncbi:hypothetical protein Z052_01870 [Halorubrum sp. C191]|nr:hypothetical protein Z052_01870 [Halorubrum sp. C191]